MLSQQRQKLRLNLHGKERAEKSSGWIHVQHEPTVDYRYTRYYAQFTGDYCSYACLHKVAESADEKAKEMAKCGPR